MTGDNSLYPDHNILLLHQMNRILMVRSSKMGRLTPLIVLLLSISFAVISYFLVGTIKSTSLSEDIRLIGIIMYLVIFFDIFLAVGRHSAGTAIHPGHLFRFPISTTSQITYLLILNALSLKSFVYAGFALVVISQIMKFSLIAGLSAVLLLILFFILIEVWLTVFFLTIGKYFNKYKILYSILGIVLLSPFYLSMIRIIDPESFAEFCASGIIGLVGNGISHSINLQWISLGHVIIQLLLLTLTGFIAGVVIIKHKEVASYIEQ